MADISGTEVLVDFADNKFPFDRDQIVRVSTARSSAGERGPAVVQLDHAPEVAHAASYIARFPPLGSGTFGKWRASAWSL